jgi:DNA-binding IscR family transcriptional regulator
MKNSVVVLPGHAAGAHLSREPQRIRVQSIATALQDELPLHPMNQSVLVGSQIHKAQESADTVGCFVSEQLKRQRTEPDAIC